MSILKITQSPAIEAPTEVVASNGDPEVDELIDLLAWAKKQSEHKNYARIGLLKKQFAERAEALTGVDTPDGTDPDDEEIVIQGVKGELKFGAKSREREIADRDLLIKKITKKTALEIAGFKMGDIDKLLTGAQKAEVLTVKRGSRSMSVGARGDVKS